MPGKIPPRTPAVSMIEPLENRTLLSAATTVSAAARVPATPSSTTTLKVSATSALLGQSVKVTVAVKAKHGKLSGSVELLDNGKPIVAAGAPLTLRLHGGKVTYMLGSGDAALVTGSHSLSAEFVSGNTVPSSTSAAFPVTIAAPTFTTESDGLQIATVKAGRGKAVRVGQTVKVLYTGILAADGTIFDFATAHGTGFTFQTGAQQAITGFDEGTVGMKRGETRVLEIPSALGYGPQGSPPSIPGNADLIFLVTLLAFK